MRLATPPKFKILVANLAGSGDPSRGPAGNPTKLRTGFILQQVVLPDGTARVAGPVQHPAAPAAGAYDGAIVAENPDYWDPTVAPPPPFLAQEEVTVGDTVLVAGETFGVGNGSGAGTVNDIAASLAENLNLVPGVRAVAVADTAYFTSTGLAPYLSVQATNELSAITAATLFNVYGPGGVLLTGAGARTVFPLYKRTKGQSAPVILR